MMIDLPYELGERVFFVTFNGSTKKALVGESNVFGYSIYLRKGQMDIRVNFKKENGVPLYHVSKDKSVIEKLVREINENNRLILGG